MTTIWIRRLLAVSAFATPFALVGAPFSARDQQVYLPGPTSGGHRQIEEKCASCHVRFSGASDDGCLRCHGQGLRDGDDSHAPAKFDDPGRAAQLAIVDARSCIPCHREHRPEARERGSLTMAAAACAGCHADIGDQRPNHRGLTADSCASVGCHNYHDNRALYRDFLLKHRDEPDLLPTPHVAVGAASDEPAALPAIDAPADITTLATYPRAAVEWNASAHARAKVNCTGCHGDNTAAGAIRWRNTVPDAVCASCHQRERAGWLRGKHGMRAAVELTAMTPQQARLPMRGDAPPGAMSCTSCHGAHVFDRGWAAVGGCERCHDDGHSRAYRGSAHEQAWVLERRGEAAPGTGVSCATCHMPRQSVTAGVAVEHDQNANLRPRNRMVRTVCMSCHGVGFSLAALADDSLVQSNFRGRPAATIRTGMNLIAKGASDAK